MQVDTHHECLVCGDRIELVYQVCSRFCMRALEQLEYMDSLDSLEAQLESPSHQAQALALAEGSKVAPMDTNPLTEAKLE